MLNHTYPRFVCKEKLFEIQNWKLNINRHLIEGLSSMFMEVT